jgi:hypothetical protein
MRTPGSRTQLRQRIGTRQQFILDIYRQSIEFRIEVIVKRDRPSLRRIQLSSPDDITYR